MEGGKQQSRGSGPRKASQADGAMSAAVGKALHPELSSLGLLRTSSIEMDLN